MGIRQREKENENIKKIKYTSQHIPPERPILLSSTVWPGKCGVYSRGTDEMTKLSDSDARAIVERRHKHTGKRTHGTFKYTGKRTDARTAHSSTQAKGQTHTRHIQAHMKTQTHTRTFRNTRKRTDSQA